MNTKKSKLMGMNVFLKLEFINRMFNSNKSYMIVKKRLKNPYICMTNTGILDSKKLVFDGSPIIDAFMCGSIKYRPHFQIALSSFKNKMTFSSNLYGSKNDYNKILTFFHLLDQELPQ
ncbi:MAG: hypothetical protein LKJ75_10180 [Clostridia bacterium]|jgi:NRPS condensation-like uncharacterized protein|nr:hypothetical protein [Clostridia bacterium]MCI2015558.1 hypothetical protein [Clostridia bacterium]